MSTTSGEPTFVDPVLAGMYADLSPEELVGAFHGASSATKAAVVAQFEGSPIPEALVEAVLKSEDEQAWRMLASRSDLSKDAWTVLAGSTNALVLRSLAQNSSVPEEVLEGLLPGDDTVRYRVFVNPAASRRVRLSAMTATDSAGAMLPLSRGFRDELQKPMYALWVLRAPDVGVRGLALHGLAGLSPARQWAVASAVAAGLVPLEQAVAARGWPHVLQNLMQDAGVVLQQRGLQDALQALKVNLHRVGRPKETQLQEAALLPDPADVAELSADELNWVELEAALRRDAVSDAAARWLLSRDDCPIGFRAAAIIVLGDRPDILQARSVSEVRAAVVQSGFVHGERDRLLRLLLANPLHDVCLVNVLGLFPLGMVLTELDKLDEPQRGGRIRDLRAGLSRRFGDAGECWRVFEEARREAPQQLLQDAVAKAEEALSEKGSSSPVCVSS